MLSVMDILKPEIINIDGRRYRKTPVRNQKNSNRNGEEERHDTYYEEDLYYEDEPETCQIEYSNIEKLPNGGYREYMKDIPTFYCRFIIGQDHEKRKEIERRTKTTIQLPPKGGTSGDIVITGRDKSGVIAARVKINTIIEMNRGDQPADHFISIKLHCEEVSKSFAEFKNEVLRLNARGVDGSIFQRAERLHLTITLLTLLNDAELQASEVQLNSIVNDLQVKHLKGSGNELKLRLQGIEYMNDDPGEVDVLYAKVQPLDEAHDVQSFVDELVETLISEGYLKKQYDRVKLHATIMNTLFRDSERETSRKKKRITFDAQPILELFSEYFFGEIVVGSLDVCIRKTFDCDGLYKVALPLPLFQ